LHAARQRTYSSSTALTVSWLTMVAVSVANEGNSNNGVSKLHCA
jgi:hypothetical protein